MNYFLIHVLHYTRQSNILHPEYIVMHFAVYILIEETLIFINIVLRWMGYSIKKKIKIYSTEIGF